MNMHLETLKIDRRILKDFKFEYVIVDLACCILYNFCKIYFKWISLSKDVVQCLDLFIGVRRCAMKLYGDG